MEKNKKFRKKEEILKMCWVVMLCGVGKYADAHR